MADDLFTTSTAPQLGITHTCQRSAMNSGASDKYFSESLELLGSSLWLLEAPWKDKALSWTAERPFVLPKEQSKKRRDTARSAAATLLTHKPVAQNITVHFLSFCCMVRLAKIVQTMSFSNFPTVIIFETFSLEGHLCFDTSFFSSSSERPLITGVIVMCCSLKGAGLTNALRHVCLQQKRTLTDCLIYSRPGVVVVVFTILRAFRSHLKYYYCY